MPLIRVDSSGNIIRQNEQGVAHSDWWVPSMIRPNGEMYFCYMGSAYNIRPVFGLGCFIHYDTLNRLYYRTVSNPNKIKIESI